jgi:hypothetical protein
MEWMKGTVLGLAFALIASPAVAQQTEDPDEGTIQDTLQEPFSETMNQPIEETLGIEGDKAEQETSVPAEESQEPADSDQGTMEDTLQSPAEETLNQPAEDTAEAVVPGGATEVMGTVKKIDEKTGYFTLETQEGQSLELHADPSMLQGMKLEKDTKVTAKYEKAGDMNHVTQLEKAEKKQEKKQKM